MMNEMRGDVDLIFSGAAADDSMTDHPPPANLEDIGANRKC